MKCFHSYKMKILGQADATCRAVSLFKQTLFGECDVEESDECDTEELDEFCDVEILENGNVLISADYDGSSSMEELVEEGFRNWANQLAQEKVSVEFFVLGSVEWGELSQFSARYQNGQFSVEFDEEVDEDAFEAIDCYDGLWKDKEDDEE